MKKEERRKRKSEEKERRRREKAKVAVANPGEGPPPLIFRPNLGPKGQKTFYSFYYFESDFSFRIST